MELFSDLPSGCGADISRWAPEESFILRGVDQHLHAYLCAKKEKRNPPPYIPSWKPMPLQKLCQLALLWHEIGFKREAGELISCLLPLKNWKALWCPEKEFNENELTQLFELVSAIEPIGEEKKAPVDLVQNQNLSAAFTLTGNGTTLGMIRAGDVEVRAFGPQTLPLSEPNRFGIKGIGMRGWTRSFALPEVWLEMKSKWEEGRLDFRFIGLRPEEPIAFVFYVKARVCQIGQEIFRPKSLRRFNGEAQEVIFDHLKIESSVPHKVQMIPLAGEGCFWNCEFLVSFEINSFDPQITYLIK